MAIDKRTVDLICPQCGYKLGEQRLFQEYEQRVATWLNAEVCAALNAGFDVWKSHEFPSLTFQVKYSTVHDRIDSKTKKRSYKIWVWTSQNGNVNPDYYVLIGLQDNGDEHCFLLTLEQWTKISSPLGNKNNGRTLQMVPQHYSRRGQSRKCYSGYVHENRGWKYEVKNPEEDLIERVRKLESYRQFELPI